jgi:WD40 repeat protein
MRRHFVAALALTLLAVPSSSFQTSLQTCPLPPAIGTVSHELNIFSEQQEIDLGDAMADGLAERIRIIDDDGMNSYLRGLGGRLVQHLPATQLKFRFYLIEFPEVNAFSIAGGRVYVSRKMVAFAKSDDELAGVIAHELGHIVTHQTAIQITARLRQVLGITRVGDRVDVFDKVHLLLENEARKPGHVGENQEKQYVADQVALYAMARAGYAPHAYVDFWDRFQQTHGKSGSWISNLFGTTKPSERRLGEMLKNVSTLPAGCADIPPGARTSEFANWQAQVINYGGSGSQESLPGLIFKQTLTRPLRPDITNLRFSPDGKSVLAQDEGGIHVLTRDPFAVLFYIPALDAQNALFTPDSRSIVFHNRSLRVENWSVAEQRQTSVHEVTVLHPCVQTELSPDGSVLGCLNSQFELLLIDVPSNSVLASRRSFIQPTAMGFCMISTSMVTGGNLRLVEMRFSPDARYFVAGANGAHFAWDVSAHHEISLPGSIRDVLKSSFAFLGPDRIIGIELASPAKSPILRFPSGERLEQVRLANGLTLGGATHGDYLFVGPLRDEPMGLLDLKNGKLPIKFKRTAADIYDGTFVTERVTGELGLNALGKSDDLAIIKLPQARLGPLRAAAVSPDFNWVALSNRTRGGVFWDVTHNIRTMELRSFHGAWFAPDSSAYIDIPKFMETERQIGRLDPMSGNATAGYKIGDIDATQYGPYLFVTKPRGRSNKGQISLAPEYFCLQRLLRGVLNISNVAASDEDVELRDVRDGRAVWSHYFPHELPSFSMGDGKVLLRWSANENAAHDELVKYVDLKNSADKTDYFLEEIDLKNDNVVGKLVLKTNRGSFVVTHVFAQDDWVIASATGNQVLIYSMTTGQEKGHFFGSYPTASRNGLLAVESRSSQISVYDLASSQLRQQYSFSDPLSFKTFSPDGNRLFVMTANQTAYIIDLTAKEVMRSFRDQLAF